MTDVSKGTTAADNGNITIDYDFEIGTYEVTNEEFCRFLNESGATVYQGSLYKYSNLNGRLLSNISRGYVRHNGNNFYVVEG